MPDTGRHDLPPSPELTSPTLIGSDPPLECPDASSAPGPAARTTRSVSGPVPRPGAIRSTLNFFGVAVPAGRRNAPRLEPISSAPSPGSTVSEPTSMLGSTVGAAAAPPSEEDEPPQPANAS